ncbi:MAG TPA: hypothetical protein VHR47_09975 [Bacillota bacterium]|nr:hypothetical protein [Bacillota bacterium]
MTVEISILRTQLQSVRGKVEELAKERDIKDPNLAEVSHKLVASMDEYEKLLIK